MGNKDKYNQSGLTGTGHQNIRKVKGETKVGGFINEGAYINFNFSDFIQGFLNFFRPEDRVAKVRSELLKGIKVEVVKRLEDSLQQNQLLINQYLELRMFSQKKAVGRSEKKKRIFLPPETKILDVFNRGDVGGKLLILGKPGAGKTTTLLRLARGLIEEAENDDDTPVPVIFELSSWRKDNLSIEDWLIEYLKDFYGMSDRLFNKSLLSQRKIMPLLDGLDELGLVRQRLCIDKINDFIGADIRTCLVVCCRDEEYQQGNVRLEKLNGAYCLKSPEEEEIYRYLEGLDKVDLWEVIQNNSQMWKLAKIPLLLNIMVTVYRGKPIYNEEQLFAAYIEECLERVPTNVEKRENLFYYGWQTRHWLTFLAKRLETENETEFLIENMQPNWLENNVQKQIYGLIYGLILGLIYGLIFGLIYGLIFGLIFWLIYGLISWLINNNERQTKIKPTQAFGFSWQKIKIGSIVGRISGLIYGLISGLIYGLISGFDIGLIFGLISGLISWFYGGLIFGPIFGLIGFLTGGVPCIEHFSLRLTLWQNGLIPWNYARFLKYATQRKLIQQVGGRFRFIHDSLRKHFFSHNR